MRVCFTMPARSRQPTKNDTKGAAVAVCRSRGANRNPKNKNKDDKKTNPSVNRLESIRRELESLKFGAKNHG